MRRKRELHFKKNVEITDFQFSKNFWDSKYSYKCIDSIYIAMFIVDEIGFSKIKDFEFIDFGESHILVKCTKKEFQDFVNKFTEEFRNDVHDIKFS